MIKLQKIADTLTTDEHTLIAESLRQGEIDGISLSYLGGAFGPTWSADRDYSLDFLKHYSGLRALEIQLPAITSIEAIAEYASNLEFLSLGEFNQKSVSLKPLSSLHQLKHLDLNRNNKDIDSISDLANLKELYLTGYQQAQIELLANLDKLEELYLGFGTFEELDALKGLSKLKSLEILWVKKLHDLSALTHLDALEHLHLSTLKQVTSIPEIAHLCHLKSVFMDTMNGLSSLSGLKGCSIRELTVINSRIDPFIFSPLSNSLPSLQRLLLGLSSKGKTKEALSFFDSKVVCGTLNDLIYTPNSNGSRIEYCR